MIGLRSVRRVFAFGAPVDMRKSFDTLAVIAREQMRHDVLRGDVFVFVGRDRVSAARAAS
ncbi:MAG: IS66 family insertion sequence element accessory protein TnpB [Polyangiales bacterium]